MALSTPLILHSPNVTELKHLRGWLIRGIIIIYQDLYYYRIIKLFTSALMKVNERHN